MIFATLIGAKRVLLYRKHEGKRTAQAILMHKCLFFAIAALVNGLVVLYCAAHISAQEVAVRSLVVSKICVEATSADPEVLLSSKENPDCPKPGDTQLIQVTVGNYTGQAKTLGVRLDLTIDGKPILLDKFKQKVRIPAHEEEKLLYSYTFPLQRSGGHYHAAARIYDEEFKQVLARSGPGIERDFVILKPSEIEAAEASFQEEKIAEAEAKKPKELEFFPADLRWERIQVIPNHVLRGEEFQIRLDLINSGGDIAQNVQAQVDYFNVRLPRRRTTIATPAVEIMAPGETVTFELDYQIPDYELLGEYQISAVVDPQQMIVESEDENNEAISNKIQLSDIKLLLPPDNFVFDETGLFLFQWDSLQYREFKLQIGTDEAFEDPNHYIALPQADRWVADKEMVPLKAEVPTMALGLMNTFGVDVLYWRVIGRRSDGKQSSSNVRSFTIRRNGQSSENVQ